MELPAISTKRMGETGAEYRARLEQEAAAAELKSAVDALPAEAASEIAEMVAAHVAAQPEPKPKRTRGRAKKAKA